MDGLREIIMAKKLRFTLPLLAAFLFMGLCISPTFAAKGGNKTEPVIITEVLVRDSLAKDESESDCQIPDTSPNEIIEISGANFPDWISEGTEPLVTLGDYIDPLVICGLTPDTILAICPTWVVPDYEIGRYECDEDGDFLLSVYTVSSEANYDLTIGAVGPAGVNGIDGAPGDDGIDGAPGTNGIDGIDGAKGDKGDPGLSLPITCESGEALNGIDEAGSPVCIPLSTVRVEVQLPRDEYEHVAVNAVCPADYLLVPGSSGFLVDNAFLLECVSLLREGTVRLYESLNPPYVRCAVDYGNYCNGSVKCVAVCEPA